MSEIKVGDMVMVIYRDDSLYTDEIKPGVVGTVVGPCLCEDAGCRDSIYWAVEFPGVPDATCCSVNILRRIDPEGRQVVSWDKCVWTPVPSHA